MDRLNLCHFRSPPAQRECLEAIWSEGRACRTCWVEFYRRGWKKKRVDEDNAKLVSERWKNDPEWNRKVER